MIVDRFWKYELRYFIRMIKIWKRLAGIFTEYAEHQVNKAILYSAVILRKMFEDEKNAETEIKRTSLPMPQLQLLKCKVKVTVYPFSGDKNFIIERFIPDNYDYKNITVEELDMNKICNQILHSYVWSICYIHHTYQIYGVIFSSDRAKDNNAYLLHTEDWIKAINFCIRNGNM